VNTLIELADAYAEEYLAAIVPQRARAALVQGIEELQAELDKLKGAEPVAWKDKTYGHLHHQDWGNSIPLYAAPQAQNITDQLRKIAMEAPAGVARSAIHHCIQQLSAPQAPKARYTSGHCKELGHRDGCQLPNLQCGYPKCDIKELAQAPAPEATK
jgi:hypothetical protein